MRRAGILRALALLLGAALAWDAALTAEAGLKAPPPVREAPAPAQEPAPAGPVELSAEELRALEASLELGDLGFFGTEFARPEEIDWSWVLHDGGGISDNGMQMRRAYEAEWGVILSDLTALRTDAVHAFVLEKTGTDYALARKPLWLSGGWKYVDAESAWCLDHGDTNLSSVSFASGTRDGDVYRLQYRAMDSRDFDLRDFVMTARIAEDGKWTFLSNVRADLPAPVELASIRFYADLDAAEAAAPAGSGRVEVEPKKTDEPFGWYGAVLTASADIQLELVRSDFEKKGRYEICWSGLAVPDEVLFAGSLKKGESIFFQINLPWNPGVEVSAWTADHSGSYLFGSDNALHLGGDPEVPADRYIMGSSRLAPGFNVHPEDAAELLALLEGSWVYYGADGEPAALLQVDGARDFYAEILDHGESYGPFWGIPAWTSGEGEGTPDLYRIHAWDDALADLPEKSGFTEGLVGAYRISTGQDEGFQEVRLSPVGEGADVLRAILPGAEDLSEIVLWRYRGHETKE